MFGNFHLVKFFGSSDKPKFAKEKDNVILSAFKQAMPPAKKPSKKVTTGLSGEELLTYMEETPKEYGWNAYRKEALKIVGDSPHRKI